MNGMVQADKFRPNIFSWVVYGFILLLLIGDSLLRLFTSAGGMQPYDIGRAAGSITGGCLCITLIAFLAGIVGFYVFRRSNRAGNIAFSGILILYILAVFVPNVLEGVNRSQQRRKEAVALEKTKQATQEMKKNMLENMIDPDAPIPGGEMMEPTIHALEQQVNIAQGDEKNLLEEVAAALRVVQSARTDYALHMNPVVEEELFAGFLHESVESLRAGRQKIHAGRDAVMRLKNTNEQLPADLEQRFKKRGIPRPLADQFMATFKPAYAQKSQFTTKSVELDIVCCDAALGTYDLLETHWGKWSVQADGTVLFAEGVSEETVNQFNHHLDAIRSAAVEQEAVNQQIYGTAADQ